MTTGRTLNARTHRTGRRWSRTAWRWEYARLTPEGTIHSAHGHARTEDQAWRDMSEHHRHLLDLEAFASWKDEGWPHYLGPITERENPWPPS